MATPAPEGYMRNALGQDVPVRLVKEIDRMRNDLVVEMAAKFGRVSNELAELKKHASGEVEAFLTLSAERYGAEIGGKKGNVTLYSYDGKCKLERTVADTMVFDESLAAAKALIDQYLDDIMQGVPSEVRMLVEKAFRPNSAGRISNSAVLGLRSLGINDERWITAMHAISESLKVMSSKAYYRVKVKDENGNRQPVCVDFAAL